MEYMQGVSDVAHHAANSELAAAVLEDLLHISTHFGEPVLCPPCGFLRLHLGFLVNYFHGFSQLSTMPT